MRRKNWIVWKRKFFWIVRTFDPEEKEEENSPFLEEK